MNTPLQLPISRRAALGAGLAVSLTSLLGACSGAGSTSAQKSGKVTVSVWTNAPSFVKHFAQRAKILDKKGPYQYKITELISAAPDVATKALAAYAANGTLPGLLGIEISQFSRFMKNNIASDALVDLTNQMGSPRSDFYSARVAPYMSSGKVYGLETAFPLVTLYKRVDLWEKYSIPSPHTWDDYLKIGGQLHSKHGISLGVIGNNDPTSFGILLQQRGGLLFNPDGSLAVDSAESVQALQLLVDGAKNGTFTVVSDFFGGPGTSVLKQGKVAAYVMPDWFNTFILQANAPEQKGKWRIEPLPRWPQGGHSTSVWGGTGFAVSKASSVRDAALKLLQDSLGTAEGQIADFKMNGYLPTAKAAWHSPEVLNKRDPYLGGQRVMDVYKSIVSDAPTQYQSQNWSILMTELGSAIQAALSGRKSASQAIKDAAANTKRQSS